MKVAHILNELRYSGAEVMLAAAAPYLLATGQNLIISTGPSVGDYAPVLTSAGFQVVHMPFSKSPLFFLSLARKLKDECVQLVHFHSERAAVWYALMARAIKVASLRTVHNEFNFEGPLRWRRCLSRQASAIVGTLHVACSPSVQQNERVRFGLRTELVNNWIDVRRVQEHSVPAHFAVRTELGLSAEVLTAVSIANESPAKNLETLFKGVIVAAERGLNIRLYHCGSIGANLRSLAESAPSGCIVALGIVEDISPYLIASQVYLCTSFNEGGQLSLLEAASAGLACITTKVGIAKAFENQKSVNFIPPDADALADALTDVASRPAETRIKEGIQLSKWARAYFVPERGALEYQRLYERQFLNAGRSK